LNEQLNPEEIPSGPAGILNLDFNRQQKVVLDQAGIIGEANATYGLLLIGIELAISEGLHVEELTKIQRLIQDYRTGILAGLKKGTREPKGRKEYLRLRDEAEALIERLKAQGFDLREYWETAQVSKIQKGHVTHKSKARITKRKES
jgi:hypothetical protein